MKVNKDVLQIFAVSGGEKKRVEVNDRKMTDEDKKLSCSATEAELQSWLCHQVFNDVNKKVADKDRVMRVRWVFDMDTDRQMQGTPLCLGVSIPRPDGGSSRQLLTSSKG